MPFFDLGGVLAEREDIERTLINQALTLAGRLNASVVELRHSVPIKWLCGEGDRQRSTLIDGFGEQVSYQEVTQKVRMILSLPESPDALLKGFKSKLRSQIKKPVKEGLITVIGGGELITDFYEVFSRNMRDLGSPVHAKAFIELMVHKFGERSRIVVIYSEARPVAASVIIQHKSSLWNPWASSLREFSKLSPNMLLYWTMLEYACVQGLTQFDFGRSTPGSGTFKFKEQWGARAVPLHWYRFSLTGKPEFSSNKHGPAREWGSLVWRKMPLSTTRVLGPLIRKQIPL